MKRLHKILVGTAGALALAAMSAVAAGPRDGMDCDGMGMGMGGMGHGRMGMMHGGRQGGDVGAMAEQRLARLKAQLKITAQQEPAWSAFATKAAEQAKAMQAQHQQATADDKVPAPERMAKHIGAMKQHLTGMEGLQGALKDLYAALTPEQRTTADEHFNHMGRRGMGRGSRG